MEENEIGLEPSARPYQNDDRSNMVSSKLTLKSRSEISQHQLDVLTNTTKKDYWKSDVSVDKVLFNYLKLKLSIEKNSWF